MIREFCAENFTNIPKAIAAGANRIELCDNLAVGGTTPSYGVIQTTIEYASQHDTEVVVMIRPRGCRGANLLCSLYICYKEI